MLRVLTTYANRTAIGFAAIGREHEDPLATCGLEECAARDDESGEECDISQDSEDGNRKGQLFTIYRQRRS